MASSKETYCLCGQPYNIGQFMIECDCCREWFHGSCVDVKIYHSDDIDKYHCPKCAQTYGPSVLKIPTNNHRADRYELGAESRPSQAGTPAWVRALAARPPRPAHAALQRMRASQFTDEFVRDNGFTRPVFFQTSEDLDMKTPNAATFTVRSVLRYCGAQLEVEVIDVRKQSTVRMPLGDFVEYFETPAARRDDRVLNVLSLEFSDTNLSPLVEPPGVIRRLDWATCVWPEAEGDPRPAVRKYCLMSSQGSYTDFHVDFGGTTVWYHVMHGRKIFYLIPPTSTNLALYQQWSAANNQNERFFGDMVEWYGTAELSAGQTLFIPSGWIHAVLTPCDSLVFGGNLLHSYAIEMQLQIYEIERRVETPTMFRYPLFEPMHWFAAAHVLATLRRHNEETQDEDFTLNSGSLPAPPPPPLLLRGAKALAAAAKDWHAAKSTDASKRDNVPKCLNSGQLVRELGKELRTLEKRAASTSSKDKEFKPRNTSPKKSHKSQQQQKKSLKLTLPKPIMHNISQNGEFVEEKVYADKFFIDNKEVTYHDNRYIPQDTKYLNGLPEAKYIVETKEVVLPEKYTYQSFEEVPFDGNGYVERQDKKGNVLRIKLNPSPPPRALPPPPYGTDHSILKAQLARDRPERPRHQQWTISKKDIGDYQEEVLFTNDNLQSNVGAQEITYGAGMYSAEDVHPAYAFEPKPAAYQPEYGYPPPDGYPADYQRYEMQPPHQPATYGASAGPTATAGTVTVDAAGTTTTTVELNGYHEPLPSYDAAMAQQYSTGYVIEEAKPPSSPLPASPTVRRSERPARRRVSSTYDYEDGDLYIDDAPAPRRRQKKHRHQYKQTASSGAGYRGRAPPANGIESLIQASVLAEEEPNDTEDAAVAGMLSIATRCGPAVAVAVAVVPAVAVAPPSAPPVAPSPAAPALAPAPAPAHHTFGLPTTTKDSGRPGRRRAAAADEPSDEEEDVIKEVHRDEEYVYPALDPSSDEEDEWPSRRRAPRNDARAKADKDESWSPRARLGRLVPRARASARAGVRRECVRAALTAAARRDAARPAAPAERPARDPAGQNAKRAVLATKSKRPPPPAPAATNNKNIRLKKGMKTAKQRLGKILKIHKMIY